MNWKFWKSSGRKSKTREWIDALVFAVVAATIIRTFLIEAFTIPTPSMEKSLLVGDFLFVSKVSYGARTPMTPLSFPFVHQELPIIGGKSYSDAIKWGYHRLPGFGNIKNNDVVVFNYPGNVFYPDDDLKRPIDKKTHYIKRCVGIPGDSLKIIDGLLYVNNKPVPLPEHGQMTYTVITDGNTINPKTLEKYNIYEGANLGNGIYQFTLTKEIADELKKLPFIKSVELYNQLPGAPSQFQKLFPFDSRYNWNIDNYGPIWIPKAGNTITLTEANLPFYQRCIVEFENNSLVIKGNQFIINGTPIGGEVQQIERPARDEQLRELLGDHDRHGDPQRATARQTEVDNIELVYHETFDKIIYNSEKASLVEFFAHWCGNYKTSFFFLLKTL